MQTEDSIDNPMLCGNTDNQHSTVFRYTELFSMHVSFTICWVMNLNMPLSKHSHDVTTPLGCEGEDVDCTVHVKEIFSTKDIFPAFRCSLNRQNQLRCIQNLSVKNFAKLRHRLVTVTAMYLELTRCIAYIVDLIMISSKI